MDHPPPYRYQYITCLPFLRPQVRATHEGSSAWSDPTHQRQGEWRSAISYEPKLVSSSHPPQDREELLGLVSRKSSSPMTADRAPEGAHKRRSSESFPSHDYDPSGKRRRLASSGRPSSPHTRTSSSPETSHKRTLFCSFSRRGVLGISFCLMFNLVQVLPCVASDVFIPILK